MELGRLGLGHVSTPSHTLSGLLEQGLRIHHDDDALGLSRCAVPIDPLQMLWIAGLANSGTPF